MNVLKFARGVPLFYEGDASKDIYGLVEGRLLVFKGNVLICELEPPSFIGELGCILNLSRSTTVYCNVPARLEVYDGKTFLSKQSMQTDEGIKFLRGLARRFELTKSRVDECQKKILLEYKKILSVLISEKHVVEHPKDARLAKKVRVDAELMVDRLLKGENVVEDYRTVNDTAHKYGLKRKFDQIVAAQLRSFSPFDLQNFEIAHLPAYLNFKTAAADIAGKVVVLTRYLADFQTVEVSASEYEPYRIEQKLDFATRLRQLRELVVSPRPGGAPGRLAELDAAIEAFARDPAHSTRSLIPLARCFDIDRPYGKSLKTVLKDSPARPQLQMGS